MGTVGCGGAAVAAAKVFEAGHFAGGRKADGSNRSGAEGQSGVKNGSNAPTEPRCLLLHPSARERASKQAS